MCLYEYIDFQNFSKTSFLMAKFHSRPLNKYNKIPGFQNPYCRNPAAIHLNKTEDMIFVTLKSHYKLIIALKLFFSFFYTSVGKLVYTIHKTNITHHSKERGLKH